MFTTTTTFIVYILAMLIIGIVAARMTSSLNDYVLGGRSLGRVVTALSAGASDMSGWLLMGLPGALFLSGISEAWIAIGLTVGSWCNWKFVAARLRSFTANASDALTLPDYLASRFCDKYRITAVAAAIIILIFFVVYCASGMVSAARLFEQTFEMDYSNALLIGAVSTIFYVFIGGFLAVSWTDTVQASLMIFALLLTPVIMLMDCGGLEAANELILQQDPELSHFLKGMTVVGFLSLVGWGLGYMGQPHILVRFMAAGSVRGMGDARRISITWMILCLLGAVLIGYYGVAFAAKHPEVSVSNPEQIFIIVTQTLFTPWIAGILLSAILAAIMSTLSCQLLVASTTLTADFYRRWMRPHASQSELVWCGRMMLLLVAVIAYVIALDPNSGILKLVSYAWAGFGASFGPSILISLFWRKMTLQGAIAGMVVGAATVIIWEAGAFFGLYSIVPGFILSSIAIFVISNLTYKKDGQTQVLFDDLERKFWLEVKDR
ncbi:sodium/proline symporter PutP [Succinatimonas hippei]|uniref:Sodium/proline symporter n=1 Tax=Succinatimonas hippei (strain DSM 22608 / JCM 16073 / KCTC 15190 / YIT 12066) TaxID=762983 RepID=E8LMI6_SUCHY|nr:sodium/proline symporter PutP [Succinatimonas hippei]EFY06278.1 sodium/proline symporter [Succinatimonas hippei YIT 12066]